MELLDFNIINVKYVQSITIVCPLITDHRRPCMAIEFFFVARLRLLLKSDNEFYFVVIFIQLEFGAEKCIIISLNSYELHTICIQQTMAYKSDYYF